MPATDGMVIVEFAPFVAQKKGVGAAAESVLLGQTSGSASIQVPQYCSCCGSQENLGKRSVTGQDYSGGRIRTLTVQFPLLQAMPGAPRPDDPKRV